MKDATPPQHIEAERSVLGAMLLNPDAITKAIDILGDTGEAFYVESHGEIYNSIINLFRDRDPVDLITLSEALTARGRLEKAGGAVYIAELTDAVPTSANCEYYADIVLQKFLKRKAIMACEKARAACYDDDVPVKDVANTLAVQVNGIMNTRKKSNIEHVRDILPRVMAQIEAQRKSGTAMMGIPTGIDALDKIMLGLRPETLNFLAARVSVGKALAIDTPIITPVGWTDMAALKVGDSVISSNGSPVTISAVTEIMYDRPCFRVKFRGGEEIVCDENHLWPVSSLSQRRKSLDTYSILSTREMYECVLSNGHTGRLNWSTRKSATIEFGEKNLPIPPYVFGYWLGNGRNDGAMCSASIADSDFVCDRFSEYGMHLSIGESRKGAVSFRFSKEPISRGGKPRESSQKDLAELGVYKNKHIPHDYLYSSVRQRELLLCGLMDSDGCAYKSGTLSFAVTRKELAEDTMQLIRSLGMNVNKTCTKRVNGAREDSSTCYTLHFRCNRRVFLLERKHVLSTHNSRLDGRRMIIDIEPCKSVPVKCIQVDGGEYLAGRQMIPTHNSAIAVNIMHNVAALGYPVLFFSLEMRSESIMKRILSIDTQTPYKTLCGTFQPEQQQYRLNQAQRRLGQSGIYIDDSGLLDVNLMRASVRKFAKDHEGKLPLFVIDYLTLVQFTQSKGRNRYEVIGEFTRELKLLANELRCPMLVLCQLSREADDKEDPIACKIYMRESGNIEQDADTIMIALAKLPKWMESQSLPLGVDREDLINFALAKNRDGDIGLCPLVFKKNTQTIKALADYGGGKYDSGDGLPIEDTYDEDHHGEF